MASPEYEQFKAQMAAAPRPAPPSSIVELRAMLDQARGNQPLAAGVTESIVDAGGVRSAWLTPSAVGDNAPVVLYLHGGGYRLGSIALYRAYGSNVATAWSARVLVVEYRLAPENPFPAAVDDALAAYEYLLAEGVSPAQIVVAGDSAGGGLTAGTLLAIKDRGLPLPAAGVCISPWADLTNSAESFRTRAAADTMFSLEQANLGASWYIADGDPKHPYASPVFGDLAGLPPLLIHVGDCEVLLDDSHTLAERARAAGVDVTLRVYDEMPHVWHMNYPLFPEAVEAVNEIGEFIAKHAR